MQRLQEAVLRDEVLDYAVERLREELQRRHEALRCQLLALREEKIREIADRVIEPGPESFQRKLDDLRTFALQRLSNIRSLLGKTGAIREARALLTEQFGKFMLNRVKEADGWSYKAEGSVNFFGDSLVRVDGAGGRNWTERLPVRFKWFAAVE